MIPPYFTGMLMGVITVLYILSFIEGRKHSKRLNQLIDDWDKSIKENQELGIELKHSLKKVNDILDNKK